MIDPSQRAGTLVIREDRVVYASEAVALLAGRPAETIAGRSPLELLVPEERARLEALRARALQGEPLPRAVELTFLLPGGGRRPVECALEDDGAELIVHVRDLSAQSERRRRLDAIAIAGVGLRTERSEEAVHARVRAELERLGLASGVVRAEGGALRIVWLSVPQPLRSEFAARIGVPPEGYLGFWTDVAAKVRDEGAAFTDDWAVHAAAFFPPEHRERAVAAVARAGFPRRVAVRLDGGEELTYLFVAGSWLESDDLPALRLFAAQMSSALDAARRISDLSRRNAHLGALNRVAQLSGEASDLPAFFARASEVIREAAGYAALAVFVSDAAAGSLLRVHAEGAFSAPGAGPGRLSAAGRLWDVLRERATRVVSAASPDGHLEAAQLPGFGRGTLACVPLVSRSRAVGVLVAGFEGGEPAAGVVDLLSAVGAHFASAIESHALLSDLRRRVDELTLLNDVAQAAAHLDPVVLLEAGILRIRETMGARWAAAYVRDGERLLLLASSGVDPAGMGAIAELPVVGGAAGAAVARLAPVLVDAAFEDGARASGAPSGPVVAVPLASKSRAVGALLLGRDAGAPLTPGESSLLASVGVQLGVAVDAARLFADVRRRLADLETVHALALRVFENAPGDSRSLLVDGAAELARALAARGATVLLADDGGSSLRVAASVGAHAVQEGVSVDPSHDALAAEVMRRRVPVVSDALGGGRELPPAVAVAVPLASRGAVRGVVLVTDGAGRVFSAADLALANALAGLIGLALENARLYDEVRHRAQELGLLHEVGRSLVQTLDIEHVLRDGIRNLARIVGAPAAHLALATPEATHLVIRATAGGTGPAVGERVPLAPAEARLAALVFARREPLLVPDAQADPRAAEEVRHTAGARAYLALPLVVRDRTIGSAVIVETRRPRVFTPAEVERAAAIANQLAVAAENARLYEDLRRSYAQLARAQQQLIAGERLAALGELSAIVAHEVRNPLGVIFNSLGSLRRLVHPTGDAKLLFDIMGEEAERLNRIVGDLLDFARPPSAPELRPEVLDRIVEDAVGAAASQHATRVEIARELDPLLPPVVVDARLVRQAVLNVAVNAIQAMPRGGRITLRTRRDGDAALVEIEDTGPGIAEEVRARIFEPFFTTKASGTGLGLAVVRRIVEAHGGRVSVGSGALGGTVFGLAFPLGGPPVENATAIG